MNQYWQLPGNGLLQYPFNTSSFFITEPGFVSGTGLPKWRSVFSFQWPVALWLCSGQWDVKDCAMWDLMEMSFKDNELVLYAFSLLLLGMNTHEQEPSRLLESWENTLRMSELQRKGTRGPHDHETITTLCCVPPYFFYLGEKEISTMLSHCESWLSVACSWTSL